MLLTGKQKRHLRALGHHLDPVVQIGKNGITEALVAQLAEAITRHELIKVKLLPECPIERDQAGEEVANAIGAELAQTLGKTLLLWKRNPQATRVELPRASGKKVKATKVEGEPADEAKKPAAKKAVAKKPAAKRPLKKKTFGDRRPPTKERSSSRFGRSESRDRTPGNRERPLRGTTTESPDRSDSTRPRARRGPLRSS